MAQDADEEADAHVANEPSALLYHVQMRGPTRGGQYREAAWAIEGPSGVARRRKPPKPIIGIGWLRGRVNVA